MARFAYRPNHAHTAPDRPVTQSTSPAESPPRAAETSSKPKRIHVSIGTLVTRCRAVAADKRNMEHAGIFLLGDTVLMLALTIAFAAGLIAAGAYWRQRSAIIAVNRQGASATIIYNDTPTVRVVDSQRVDRLRKVVHLTSGAHVDILEAQPNDPPRFRITLKSIVERAETAAAHIVVDLRGTSLSCGPLVEEVGHNEFVLPRALRDEPRSAVFHYQERGDALGFLRIKVRAIDAEAKTAEIDVMQVQGHWPT